MFLEVSVHVQLAYCFWACDQAAHYCREYEVDHTAHLMVTGAETDLQTPNLHWAPPAQGSTTS